MFTHMTGHNNMISMADPGQSRAEREYGRSGFFGILTPQGNPTVEPELAILLPAGSAMLTARLTGTGAELRQRLVDYVDRLDATLNSFASASFDAIGFACTGSSYLVTPAQERGITARIEDARSCAAVTAAQAVEAALDWLGIRRIAMISPYPEWLTAACRDHWEAKGLTVSAVLQLAGSTGPSHGIYALTTPAVLDAARAFQTGDAQAILVTGTGMPSLRVIAALEAEQPLPVLSSNLCLAWALAKTTGAVSPGPESRLYGGWLNRLSAIT
jgi:maleate isomerase